jgi:ABC-type maltose transport system permease subunit
LDLQLVSTELLVSSLVMLIVIVTGLAAHLALSLRDKAAITQELAPKVVTLPDFRKVFE